MGVAWALWAACACWAPWARGAPLPQDAERLRAAVGGHAVMDCHLDFPFGIEIPYHLQWDKDGEEIFSWYSGEGAPRAAERWAGRVRRVGGGGALGGGALNLSSVRESDAGLYRCRVSFPNRTPPARNNGTFYHLDVDGGNLIATPPTNVTVLEGAPAELQCAPRSAAWRVQWFRGGAPVGTLPALAARLAPATNGSLLLRRAASSDLAQYECRVSAPDGQTQSAAAFLDVQYAAKVVHSPEERLLPHGKPASLDCHFSANPPLTNLRWEKDGFLFDPYNVPGVFYSRNGSLLFNRVDESHAGVYSCTPYNALGSAGASRGVRVRVLRPPALAAAPQPLYVARLGGAVTLPCRAADGAADVRWSRADGRALPAGAQQSGGNLTLRGLAAADRGVYECRVSNDAAELRVHSELLLADAPRAPHALVATRARGGLSLAWAPGADAAQHAVWYRERGAAEWRSEPAGVASALLSGLRAGATYELRVLAQGPEGDGLLSRPVFARTADPENAEDDMATEYTAEAEEEPASTETTLGTRVLDVTDVDDDDVHDVTDVSEVNGADVNSADDAARWSADGDRDVDAALDELDDLDVRVRLLDEGALVTWRSGARACELRWYDDALPERRLLAAARAPPDYALVGELQEGGRYWAAVRCAGARGGAALAVPQYARLRGVALGSAAAALLLAALAGVACAARRRLGRHKRAR